MASLRKSYFLPPAWVYKPGGPIFLGSIISDPKVPERSLNADQASSAASLSLTIDDEQDSFHAVIDASTQHEGGVDASFLSMFGVGGSVGGSKEKKTSYTLEIERLQTREIEPDDAFINKGLASAKAADFLTTTKFKADLYCITGLMTGDNVTITSSEERNRGFKGRLGVSGAPAGVPLEIGPNYARNVGDRTEVSSQRKTQIIVGYRLKRISYRKKQKDFTTGDHVKGAVLADGERTNEGEDGQVEYVADLVKVDEDEIGAEDFVFRSVVATSGESKSGGSSFEFVVPEEL